MEYFALSAFRVKGNNLLHLEIQFQDDLLDCMKEVASMYPVATYKSITFFTLPVRRQVTMCDEAEEFVSVVSSATHAGIVLGSDGLPLTEDTMGYFEIYEAADAALGIVLK